MTAFMLLCTFCLRELLQVIFLEIDRISGLEFALIYGRISSDCCMLKRFETWQPKPVIFLMNINSVVTVLSLCCLQRTLLVYFTPYVSSLPLKKKKKRNGLDK